MNNGGLILRFGIKSQW